MTLDRTIQPLGTGVIRENVLTHEAAPRRTRIDVDSEELTGMPIGLDADRRFGTENYKQLRRRLMMLFRSNRCLDPDDLVSEVFYRAAAKLRSEDIRDLVPYCIAIAKNIVLEVRRKTWRESSLEDLVAGGDELPDFRDRVEIADNIDKERMIACLRRCISRLRPDEQELLIEYYDTYKGEQIVWRQKLAEKAGLTMEALRTRMNRLRERIEPSVKKCRKSPRRVSVPSRVGT